MAPTVNPNDGQPPVWNFDHLTNVGHVVSEAARHMGDSVAIAAPTKKRQSRPLQYNTLTFGELEGRSNRIANMVADAGITPGTRVALMIPPGIDFVSYVFGLFKAGAVIILIDPGMGRKNMVRCLAEAKPAAMVGVALAHIMRNIFRSKFSACRTNIVTGGGWFPGCLAAKKLLDSSSDTFKPLGQDREAEAAIIFTTGSTGPPKGVLYRHRIFLEQARQIRDYFDIRPGSVDVSGFPLFALFNCAMGTATIFPRMDATRPAEVDPLDIKDAVDHFAATQSFGSPALWNTVSRYANEHGLTFPTVKKILSAGAPVPPHVLQRIKGIIAADGEAYTPYGATESLPVACNNASTVLGETAEKTASGAGTCVGSRFPDMQWKVIRISDAPITNIEAAEELPSGEIGELIVSGAVVTDQYVTRTDANAEHKIADPNQKFGVWHRMGDVGYFDQQERFWFCGRKSHRVTTSTETLYTIPVEGIINCHEKIYRSALVGVGEPGNHIPVLIVEPWPEHWTSDTAAQGQLMRQIAEICQSHDKTRAIKHVLIKKKLPVDIRHNSKIFREQLRSFAAKQLAAR